MSISAAAIVATAPLGALVRFSNDQPRPPARFTRKLRDWENHNGIGRLVERHPGRDGRCGDFALHLGDFGGGGVVILTVRRIFTADSRSTFVVERVPMPGEALVLTEFNGRVELRHLAPNEAAAGSWLEEHRYSKARIEVVAAPSAVSAAA